MSNYEQHSTGTDKDVIRTLQPQATLPEYLRKETLAGLMPDTPVYKYPSVVAVDVSTGILYVDTSTEVTDKDTQLETYVHNKDSLIGLMSVLDDGGGVRYVVDATGVRPGLLRTEEYLFADLDNSEFEDRRRREHVMPAAIAFTDLEGRIELRGDPDYFDSLAHLVQQFDEAIASNTEQQPASGKEKEPLEPMYYGD